jgi:hypothetical protein
MILLILQPIRCIINRNNCFGARMNQFFNPVLINTQEIRSFVYKNFLCSILVKFQSCSYECVSGNNYLISPLKLNQESTLLKSIFTTGNEWSFLNTSEAFCLPTDTLIMTCYASQMYLASLPTMQGWLRRILISSSNDKCR